MNDPVPLTDGVVERARIAELEAALQAVIRTREDPGAIGTVYATPRAISYARSVLNVPVES